MLFGVIGMDFALERLEKKVAEISLYETGDAMLLDKNNEIINRLVIKYDSVGNVAKLSNYAVSQKFGTTVNELTSQTEFVFEY